MSVQSECTSADFETIFKTHWPGIYGVIYRIVGDHAEAEDLALDTFVRLHQRRPRNWDNIPGWLYRVATNAGLNALRSLKRRAQYETQAGRISLERGISRNPAAIFDLDEERQQVRLVLSRMKRRSARLLILRYSGFSYAEIASSLGIRPNSVGTLLSRAEKEFEKHYRG